MKKPELSLLIPTYNEADIIESALTAIAQELGSYSSVTEIIVVDDGKDDLPEIVNKVQPTLPFNNIRVLRNNPPLGKGKSLACGFKVAQADITGFMDVDLSTPPRYIKIAVEAIKSDKTDIFIGSRKHDGSHVTREQFFLKDILGKALGVVARFIIFFGMRNYNDTQCGFKFFKTRLTGVLYSDLLANDGLNDLEVLIRANILNYRVQEHGVQWTDLRESKRSLRRILWGELQAISKILFYYKFLPSTKTQLVTKAQKTS